MEFGSCDLWKILLFLLSVERQLSVRLPREALEGMGKSRTATILGVYVGKNRIARTGRFDILLYYILIYYSQLVVHTTRCVAVSYCLCTIHVTMSISSLSSNCCSSVCFSRIGVSRRWWGQWDFNNAYLFKYYVLSITLSCLFLVNKWNISCEVIVAWNTYLRPCFDQKMITRLIVHLRGNGGALVPLHMFGAVPPGPKNDTP